MDYPNFNEEKKLWRKGHERIFGIDEVGRGPLAGPVVASAVVINKSLLKNLPDFMKDVKDSKKVKPEKREEIWKMVKETPGIEWGIGRVSEKVIDKINILEATKLAMRRAMKDLEKKYLPADFLILDGNMKIDSIHSQKGIIKADDKVYSCALASIVAKVDRDRIMERYHVKYPQYCFNRHKGYPTEIHRKMIRKHGFCPIHRRTFSY